MSKVAYRTTWAYKDANGNLVEGAPSSRLVLTNFSSDQSGTVDLVFAIPSDITVTDTQYFYRIYRTAVVESTPANIDNLDPGEEMNLVIEDFPSNAQLTARSVEVNDLTPESFRAGGTPLYTNPVSGEGILQANTRPPLAKDVDLFQNTVFYANTQLNQQLQLSLLSVSQLVSGVSTFTITQGMTTNTYTFVGLPEEFDLTFDTFANTTDGGYFILNAASDLRSYVFYADKTGTTPAPTGLDTVGKIIIPVDISLAVTDVDVANAFLLAINNTFDFSATILGAVLSVTTTNNGNTTDPSNGLVPLGGAFTILVTQQGDGENQATLDVLLSGYVSPSQAIDETARSLVNIINNNPLEVVNAFYLSGATDVPGLILFKTRDIAAASFSLTVNNAATGSQFSPTLPTTGTSVSSESEVEPNALYYSKFQQPEAVPIVNKFNVGPKDKAILRILALRGSLFVLKEDGVYRVTGQAGSFVLDAFDYSAIITAPDSAVVLNNQIYMLSSQGVVRVTDTGVDVISRPIEGVIDRVTSSTFDFKYTTFGVRYESDRSYLLALVSDPNDTVANQIYRFNTFTNSWTRWPISKTCGIVKPADDRLYFGPADVNFIERERKDFLRTDFADREYPLSITQDIINDVELTLSSLANVQNEDVLLQEQYLTIFQFNTLLKKLDLDPFVQFNDYFSSLGVSVGVNFRNALDDLATKLDMDTGVNNSNFSSSIGSGTTFVDFQNDFNIIVNLLNTASGVKNPTFKPSSGTITFETLIVSSETTNNTVIILFPTPFIFGPVTLYKGIKTDIIWAPQTFGDPSILKQVSEGTYLFEDTVFYKASVSYASDLTPNFEGVDFEGSGLGDFSLFYWGDQTWGGGGSQVPLRTYIPRNKQRCRFLRPRFEHGIAREKFSLFGVSLTFRPISTRAYRS